MGVLEGKSALVTGAGQGVGQGIAFALAGAGASVLVSGRTRKKLDSTCAEIERRGGKAVPFVCDVAELDQIEACVAAAIEAFGTIDILVNNAQSVPLGRLLEVTDEAFEAGWRTGPLAALRFMRLCHPYLRDGGVIVNLASGSALRTDPGGFGAYAAVKEDVRTLTRAAACEWGPDGIRVNAIMPLAMSPGMKLWSELDPEEFEAVRSSVPLRRIGDCESDIGRAVVMLVGPDASYVTGTTWMLDGGQSYLR
jgi:NAD(P)-dependent dehydrogenase (short-subunit alcohol dehydrogenase family)